MNSELDYFVQVAVLNIRLAREKLARFKQQGDVLEYAAAWGCCYAAETAICFLQRAGVIP